MRAKKRVNRNTKFNVHITIPGEPITKCNAYRTGKGHFFIPKRQRDYENVARAIAEEVMDGRPFVETPVKVTIWFILGTHRRKDIQNLLKTSLDAFNKIVYKDDSQVEVLTVYKQYDKENPRAEVYIEEI